MPSSPGRTTEPRVVAGVGTTSGSAALTGSAGSFNKQDIGRVVTGAGIPAAATISAVASGTAATLSANATATATIALTFTTTATTSAGYGFTGWSPETDAESQTYAVLAAGGAGVNDPARLTDAVTRVTYRNR